MTNREIDALVAEKVMGLRPCSDPIGRCDGAKMVPCQCWGTPDKNGIVAGGKLSCYSTSIEAAWQVVEKLSIGHGFSLFHYQGLSSCGFGYVAVFAISVRPYSVEIVTIGDPTKVFHGHSDSAPLAICLAALKAVGVEVPHD